MTTTTRRSLATFLFAPLLAQAEPTKPQNWFVQGDNSGNLVMIDMAEVTSITRHDHPIDPQNPLVYGEVIVGSQQILLGRELMDLFIKVFGQWLSRQGEAQ